MNKQIEYSLTRKKAELNEIKHNEISKNNKKGLI